jgi:hypothetical protein
MIILMILIVGASMVFAAMRKRGDRISEHG